ncbi:uncharacterized protein avpi1 isoform X2 [Melanotaenia boesemani]|nr:uncharacterized protein avpi1 isoform X2 [Melanotaenia boesemani]
MDADVEGADDEKEQEEEEWEDEAGLAQALVGLRVQTRNKAGIRVAGHREHKWLRASGYLRVEEPLSGYTVKDEAAEVAQSLEEFQLPTEEDIPENKNPFKPSSWRLGIRLEGARDCDHYLHRILH